MICLSCRAVGPRVCEACSRTIRPVPPGVTPGGVPVLSWAAHDGAASVLVRRLKYEAIVEVARLVGPVLADSLPADARCLVPVARCLVRRVRYGIDAASELARAVSAETGIRVVHALVPPLWSAANAGAARAGRQAPRFRARASTPGAVLVDDVATTGTTLDAAAASLTGVVAALTATRVH